MASSSYFLLAMAALAALFAAGSCGGDTVTLTIGKGTTKDYSHMVLIANLPIHELAIRERFANEFLDDMKEGPPKTFTMDFKTPLKGPLSVRFSVAKDSYRNHDDFFELGLKPGTVLDTTIPFK